MRKKISSAEYVINFIFIFMLTFSIKGQDSEAALKVNIFGVDSESAPFYYYAVDRPGGTFSVEGTSPNINANRWLAVNLNNVTISSETVLDIS